MLKLHANFQAPKIKLEKGATQPLHTRLTLRKVGNKGLQFKASL